MKEETQETFIIKDGNEKITDFKIDMLSFFSSITYMELRRLKSTRNPKICDLCKGLGRISGLNTICLRCHGIGSVKYHPRRYEFGKLKRLEE